MYFLMILESCAFVIRSQVLCSLKQTIKTPPQHTLPPKSQKNVIVRNVFHILDVKLILLFYFQILSEGFLKTKVFQVLSKGFYSLNIMLRVSFFHGRDRACRHCWISSFWTPPGKTAVVSKNRPFRQYLNNLIC